MRHITPEMFIRLVEEVPDRGLNGRLTQLKRHRGPVGVLGRLLVCDIGKRIVGRNVESSEQMERRTGLSHDQIVARNENLISQAVIKYKGYKNFDGTAIEWKGKKHLQK